MTPPTLTVLSDLVARYLVAGEGLADCQHALRQFAQRDAADILLGRGVRSVAWWKQTLRALCDSEHVDRVAGLLPEIEPQITGMRLTDKSSLLIHDFSGRPAEVLAYRAMNIPLPTIENALSFWLGNRYPSMDPRRSRVVLSGFLDLGVDPNFRNGAMLRVVLRAEDIATLRLLVKRGGNLALAMRYTLGSSLYAALRSQCAADTSTVTPE